MIRKLKTLGVAVVAVLALSAIGASASQAANFTASSYPASFTAESAKGNDVFTTEAGAVECKSHFSGSQGAASSTVEVTAVYTECRAFGFLSAEVNMTGCKYLFHVTAGSADAYTGSADLTCPAGVSVDINASTCSTTVPAQTGLTTIDFTNNTAAGDISVQATVKEKINYTVTKDGLGCPFNGTGAKTKASYTQGSAVTVDSTQTLDIG